jgi:hypothetical protein
LWNGINHTIVSNFELIILNVELRIISILNN